MLNYEEYIRIFNSGEDALLLERFFDADIRSPARASTAASPLSRPSSTGRTTACAR